MSDLAYPNEPRCRADNRCSTDQTLEIRLRMMSRELFYTWIFISQAGLWEEAREFIQEQEDVPTPLEW